MPKIPATIFLQKQNSGNLFQFLKIEFFAEILGAILMFTEFTTYLLGGGGTPRCFIVIITLSVNSMHYLHFNIILNKDNLLVLCVLGTILTFLFRASFSPNTDYYLMREEFLKYCHF